MLATLPTISYNKSFNVSDITAAVPFVTVPTITYGQQQSTRGDVIADQYYGNDTLDYLVFACNNTVNPVDLQVANEDQTNAFIVSKYGTIENAQRTIIHFRNNWRDDDQSLGTVAYNSLAADVKQLFQGVADYRGQITSYVRKPIDIYKTTSQIVVYNTNGVQIDSEYVTLKTGSTVIGTGRVVRQDDESITVDHVVGGYICTSLTDDITTAVVTVRSMYPVISLTEAPYYSPVYAYDSYVEQMTTKRQNIQLYPLEYVDTVVEKLNNG